jgi:hypothetical protein
MTQAISNKTNMEPEPEEIWNAWQEWEDGDDSAIYDKGYTDGYKDGLIKASEILFSVKEQPQVDRLPSSFTVSVVLGTIREILKGN